MWVKLVIVHFYKYLVKPGQRVVMDKWMSINSAIFPLLCIVPDELSGFLPIRL
jgi:hypothetical protein